MIILANPRNPIKFTRLRATEDPALLINNKTKTFKQIFSINEYVEESVKWAVSNQFNEGGRSRDTVVTNALLGKLGEFVVYKFFSSMGYNPSYPDLSVKGKGEWDDGHDLTILDGIKLNIKTSTHYSNTLLLKKSDWDSEGNYIYRKISDDLSDTPCSYFFLCRVKPNLREVLGDVTDYNNSDEIIKALSSVNFRADIPGFIRLEDFRKMIAENLVIEEGKKLNSIKFDIKHDMYYCQSGDLIDIDEIKRIK